MLHKTFVHIRGVGPATERKLWARGFSDWSRTVANGGADRVARRFVDEVRASQQRIAARDAAYFHRRLPPSERWRMYCDFARDAAFLDIETTGLSPEDAITTVVGVFDQAGFRAYVRGQNLDRLPEALESYRLIVTYNGAGFDLPFLEKEFARRGRGRLFSHAAHLDLRYPLRRLGFQGGLKRIERALGAGRPDALASLDGFDAVRLWRMATAGEQGALATLIRYNAEDAASLPRLAGHAVARLAAGTPLAECSPPTFPRLARETLPYDRALVAFLASRRGGSRWRL